MQRCKSREGKRRPEIKNKEQVPVLPGIEHIDTSRALNFSLSVCLSHANSIPCSRAEWSANGKVVPHESRANMISHSEATTVLSGGTQTEAQTVNATAAKGFSPQTV